MERSRLTISPGIGDEEYLVGQIVNSNVQVSRLHNGDNVVNGVLSRDVAMVGSQLPAQHLVVGRTQPVHACGHGVNDECEGRGN